MSEDIKPFRVVAPSIPGFGFSGPTTERGWGANRAAAAFPDLLCRLGYERFGAHGGDWGAIISRELAVRHPDRVLGLHLMMLPGAVARSDADLAGLTGVELERVEAHFDRGGHFPGLEQPDLLIGDIREFFLKLR
jgi:pimeloyl-ACP methyl ester carboxylesterase